METRNTHTGPYGLHRAHGFASRFLAKQTVFDEADLAVPWQALGQMSEHDRGAARGEMAKRGLCVFEHESEQGDAHAHALFDLITASPQAQASRSFGDYRIRIDESGLPAELQVIRRVG